MREELGGSEVLFYDTYALYAIATGKESYLNYVKGKIITGLMNLYEFYYILIKENNKKLAEEFFNRLVNVCVKINPTLIKEAANFRFKEIKRKLSYVDCLGYIIAKNNKVKFLTGDVGFKGLPNVIFVE